VKKHAGEYFFAWSLEEYARKVAAEAINSKVSPAQMRKVVDHWITHDFASEFNETWSIAPFVGFAITIVVGGVTVYWFAK
jgi:hypothetical protein